VPSVLADIPLARRGRRAAYGPKVQPGVQLTLTRLAHGILEAAARRTGMSRADVVEQLLRRHGHTAQPSG
jgi:hypothetical protein